MDNTHVPADHGISHIALEVPDVHAAHKALTDAGYVATVLPTDLGVHITFYVRGPDGEILEVLEERGSDPATMRALQAKRGHVGFSRKPAAPTS